MGIVYPFLQNGLRQRFFLRLTGLSWMLHVEVGLAVSEDPSLEANPEKLECKRHARLLKELHWHVFPNEDECRMLSMLSSAIEVKNGDKGWSANQKGIVFNFPHLLGDCVGLHFHVAHLTSVQILEKYE
jgi:hypothetical protein